MCREGHNIWFWFFKHRDPIHFFKAGLYRGYFWEDSFGQYINRFILCPLLGHRKKHFFEKGHGCESDEAYWYCFNCHQQLPPLKGWKRK